MDNNVNKTHYANCNISNPILYPNKQAVSFNGFAWSPSMGMIHEINTSNNKEWQQWLGTQQ